MAVDMFLQVNGVTGESHDANHPGWSDILSYSWGSDQPGNMSVGGGGGAGKIQFTDLHVSASLDKATSAIHALNASGKHVDIVKISICKAGGSQIEYATVVLKDVIVTSVHHNGTWGAGQVNVSYSFQAAQVEQHYWVQSSDGTKGAESQMGWDIKANKVL